MQLSTMKLGRVICLGDGFSLGQLSSSKPRERIRAAAVSKPSLFINTKNSSILPTFLNQTTSNLVKELAQKQFHNNEVSTSQLYFDHPEK